MILEVCVDSIDSLLIAKQARANRIELCSTLGLGGLTPSYGLMKQARDIEELEIFIMIRPRSGDFLYNSLEYATMKEDIKIVKELGFDGIVTGFLLANGKIDLKRVEEVVELASPLEVVFHRAFDHGKDPEKDIGSLIDLGVKRILTSGQREDALKGAEYIRSLQDRYGSKIEIMPGAGINPENIKEIYKRTGCRNYHMSGRVNIASQMEYRESRQRMNTPVEEFIVEKSDYRKIKKVRTILDKLNKKI